MKLNYKRTILVGFAFFLICAFWQAYDNTVPLILTNKFGMSQTWSGVIMALDNVLALFLNRGTPHTQAILPLLAESGVPLVGPSTGAMLLQSATEKVWVQHPLHPGMVVEKRRLHVVLSSVATPVRRSRIRRARPILLF